MGQIKQGERSSKIVAVTHLLITEGREFIICERERDRERERERETEWI